MRGHLLEPREVDILAHRPCLLVVCLFVCLFVCVCLDCLYSCSCFPCLFFCYVLGPGNAGVYSWTLCLYTGNSARYGVYSYSKCWECAPLFYSRNRLQMCAVLGHHSSESGQSTWVVLLRTTKTAPSSRVLLL